MIVVKTRSELAKELAKIGKDKTIGFVPTMGALHSGHASLIKQAVEKTDFVVASVFVNPRQFNNQEDLEKYPNTLDADIELLEKFQCDLLFAPSKEEVYQDYDGIELDLGKLDSVMEGANRPGHFKGVVDVVYRLFDLIQPSKAFFGLKDFQQVAVIQHLVRSKNLDVEIVPCPTIREENGLARSSRNMRLSQSERDTAKVIYWSLMLAREWSRFYSVEEVRNKCKSLIDAAGLKTEYVAIINPQTLDALTDWESPSHLCVVAHCGEVRLIDNLQIRP